MLKSLEIENFKTFGKRIHVDFAPITLIFGENSAGKSSILQSLNLLKQTRESREYGASLLPRTENGFVDLGSFQELLYDHELERQLQFRIELETEDVQLPYRVPDLKSISMEIRFGFSSEREIELKWLDIFKGSSTEPYVSLEPTKISKEEFRKTVLPSFLYRGFRGQRIPKRVELNFAKFIKFTRDKEIWMPLYESAMKYRQEIINTLNNYLAQLGKKIEPHLPGVEVSSPIKEGPDIKEAIQFYSREFALEEFMERQIAFKKENIIGLDGFIPLPLPLRPSEKTLPEFSAMGRQMAFRAGRFVFEPEEIIVIAGMLVERMLKALFPMGPIRRPPERWYIYTGTRPQDVGYKGELLPDLVYKNRELLNQTNKWLDRLQIGYEIKVESVGSKSKDLFELRLIDKRRISAVQVGLSDVGYGVSQLLPFIVQSLVSENQIISIEQPEVHIHPKLQADLGDLLIEAIRPPRNNRFIIETHSEHIILRLQKLIREKKLKPEEISVIYVSRNENGASVERLRLDSDGRFLDEWPGGFFPERTRELF